MDNKHSKDKNLEAKQRKASRKKIVVKKRRSDINKNSSSEDRITRNASLPDMLDGEYIEENGEENIESTRVAHISPEMMKKNAAGGTARKKSSSTHRKKRRGRRRMRGWKLALLILGILFGIGFICGLVGVGIGLKWMSEAPELDLSKFEFVDATAVYDINGDYYQELQTSERRDPVTIQQVPELVQLAFVSIEDQRYYSHFGVDIRGTVKAIIGVLTTGSTEGSGGSTITQQLIKQTHVTSEKSIQRKVMEWKLAYQLEKVLSKRQILEAYLNKINLSSAWGVESAAELYFGLSVDQLSVAQSATIASIMKAPTYYNPYSYIESEDGNFYLEKTTDEEGVESIVQSKNNVERAIIIVDKMYELGHISQREHEIAVGELKNNQVGLISPQYTNEYTYFTDAVYEEVLEDLQEQYDLKYEDAVDLLLNGGLKIYSTIDPVMQRALDAQAANDGVFPAQTSSAANASAAMSASTGEAVNYTPEIGGAVIQNSTGYVVGIVGGRTKSGSLTMNRALQKFQTGSATKPVSTYAPALETGTVTLATTFDDIPLSFGGWTPGNAGNTYYGMMTVREGLTRSENIVAAQVEYLTGHEVCASYAEKFGLEIEWENSSDINGAALALGGYTYGQTPLAMASAFSVFPNKGIRISPTFYRYVTDSKGETLLESKQETTQVISEQTAWLITSVLKNVVRGGTTYISIPGQELAGKTGTTDHNMCCWFCGYTAEYTGAFWMGYDQQKVFVNGTEYNLRIGVTGGTSGHSPAYFFQYAFRQFYAEKGLAPASLPAMPERIIEAGIDSVSGKAPTELSARDPRGSTVISEYFIEGTYPAGSDQLHREFLICADTGLLANVNCPHIVKRVLVYKDPAIVYIGGGLPYRNDYLVGSRDVGVMAPSSYCTSHNVDSKIASLAFGTSSDASSTVDSYLINESDSGSLYVYKVALTNVMSIARDLSPSVESSNPSVATAEFSGGVLTIHAHSQGTTTITVTNVFNQGISGVLGLGASGESTDTPTSVNYEYTARGRLAVTVTASAQPPQPEGESE